MRTNTEYKNAALAALKGNWAPAALLSVVYLVIAAALEAPSSIVALTSPEKTMPALDGGSSLIMLLLCPFLMVGTVNAFRLLFERKDANLLSNSINIGKDNYLHKLWGVFLMEIYIVLWTLLLVIPGIIKSFSYAMTPYILDEHPELSANEAIDKSRAMMRGHKFDLFYLYLSFIGWILLTLITCGIGFIWLYPYLQTATAAFYYDLKVENGEAFPEAEIV